MSEQANLAEIQAGTVALQKADNPQVKALAQRMVDDHTKMSDQEKQLAEQLGVTLPTQPDPHDAQLMTKLQNETGQKFDKQFVDAQVSDHEKVIKEFQKEAFSGTNPQVKELATQGIPILQEHLQMAQQAKAALQ